MDVDEAAEPTPSATTHAPPPGSLQLTDE